MTKGPTILSGVDRSEDPLFANSRLSQRLLSLSLHATQLAVSVVGSCRVRCRTFLEYGPLDGTSAAAVQVVAQLGCAFEREDRFVQPWIDPDCPIAQAWLQREMPLHEVVAGTLLHGDDVVAGDDRSPRPPRRGPRTQGRLLPAERPGPRAPNTTIGAQD